MPVQVSPSMRTLPYPQSGMSRRAAGLLISTLAGLALACAVLFAGQPPQAALARPLNSPSALTYPGPGACSTTLQNCINSAVPGDTINIAPGLYITSVTLNQAVSLVGAGLSSTVIQALPAQRVLTVSGIITSSTRIADMTLEGGNESADAGGGIFVPASAQPLLQNLLVISNSALACGGIYAKSTVILSNVTISGNTAANGDAGGLCAPRLFATNSVFQNNTALGSGGGALVNSLWLTNATFINNSAADGGGVKSFGPAQIFNSIFQNNHAQTGSGGGLSILGSAWVSASQFLSNTAQGDGVYGGGAIAASQSITALNSTFTANTANTSPGGALSTIQNLYLVHCTFTANTAVAGDGGSAFVGGAATLDHARFNGNQSGAKGGALATSGTLAVSNTLVVGNFAVSGGGLYQSAGDGRIVNSLFARNAALSTAGMQLYLAPTGTLAILFTTVGAPGLVAGDAILVAGGSVQLEDSIVTNHAIGLRRQAGTVSQDYNLFFGNTANTFGAITGGAHNASGDPRFANPAVDDYHLLGGSAAIDAGLDVGVNTDIDDEPRPVGAGFDLGYDEFTLIKILLPLVMR